MASQISEIPEDFRFIDAGAGVGMLSATICERIAILRVRRSVHADLYETDPAVLPALRETMQSCEEALFARGHHFSYAIHEEDFVLRRPCSSLFSANGMLEYADAVIMNPPYLKLPKDSPQARAFAELIHGQPNIYALFMAAAVELLKPGGELVALTPRSFCNGLYFREFRRWFLSRMALRHVHVFESRRATFKDSEVLQESIITLATKQRRPHPAITVSSSHGTDTTGVIAQSREHRDIIEDSSGDVVIRLPSSAEDMDVMKAVESWSATFAQRGLRISTGPVVSFRATEFLLPSTEHPDAIPLLSMHNIRPYVTVWPVAKGRKPVAFRACDAAASLMLPAKNYVLLRRFSAKEEQRRLVASIYLPSAQQRKRPIALENHINYVTHQERELSPDEARGLAAVFNAAFLDRYFRTLSGNTQVNATEIRAMPFPDLATIGEIGKRITLILPAQYAMIETIVLEELGIDGAIIQRDGEIAT
jgi:adenine-specific DNA-methyltransferase